MDTLTLDESRGLIFILFEGDSGQFLVCPMAGNVKAMIPLPGEAVYAEGKKGK